MAEDTGWNEEREDITILKKLVFEGEKKNKNGTGGGSFWSLLFCCISVGKT